MTYSAVAQDWISITDLTAATRMTLTEDQAQVAAVLLERYAGEAESVLSRAPSMRVTDELAEVVGDLVVTRHRPVVSVQSLDGYTAWDTSSGNIRLLSAPYPATGTRILTSYTAGFQGPRLTALRGVVIGRTLRMVQRDADDALAVSNVNEEGHSDSYLPDDWTEGERATLESLRRRIGAR